VPADAPDAAPSPPPPVASRSSVRLQRVAFYAVWVVGLPLGLAILVVWGLTRSTGAGAGSLQMAVADQKIPAGILLFTAFAIVAWRFRYDLPLSAAAGVGGRRDVPQKLRSRYEDAELLLEEARRILKARKRDIERELTSTEREDVAAGLDELERALNGEPFVAATFEKSQARAERLVGEHLARWRKGEIREYAESILIAIAVAFLLRIFVVEAFKIPSSSMVPTLMVGDHIFVNKFKYGPVLPLTDKRMFSSLPPARGDVIVFKFPENMDQDFIKRVITNPGDSLTVVDGRPIINGWLVPHCHVGTFRNEGAESELYVEYLNERAYFTLFKQPPSDVACETTRDCPNELSCHRGLCGRDSKDFKNKPGEVWVLGDNRDNSHDSRAWNKGTGGGVPFDNIKGRAMVIFATFVPTGSEGGVFERFLLDVMGRPRLPDSNAHLRPAADKCLREIPKVTLPPNP
jgi:signal peptidase I